MSAARPACTIAALACASALGTGCHCVASLDDLELREPAAPPDLAWVVHIGNAHRQMLTGLDVDPDGDIVVALSFKGQLEFDQTLTSHGDEDLAVVKLDGNGAWKWSRSFGGASRIVATSLYAGPSSAIALAGWFKGGPVLFGADELSAAGTGAFAALLDAEGTPLWGRSLDASGTQRAWGVVMSGGSDVIVAGEFESAPLLQPGAVETGLDAYEGPEKYDTVDGFLMRLDDDGSLKWAHALGGPGFQMVGALARAADEHLFVAGTFAGTMDLGGHPVASENTSHDVFIAELQSNGDFHQVSTYGGGTDNCFDFCELALAVGSDETPVAAGAFGGTFDFGTTSLETGLDIDVFLARFDEFGEQGAFRALWAQVLDDGEEGAVPKERPYGLAVASDGSIAVAGHFTNRLVLGDAVADNADEAPDLFVVVFDRDGALRWGTTMPITAEYTQTADDKEPFSPKVTFDQAGDVIVAGWFRNEIVIGDHVLASSSSGQGDADAFVAKFVIPPAV